MSSFKEKSKLPWDARIVPVQWFIEHDIRERASAVGLDAKGRYCNMIIGEHGDSDEVLRRAARQHWPHAKEV